MGRLWETLGVRGPNEGNDSSAMSGNIVNILVVSNINYITRWIWTCKYQWDRSHIFAVHSAVLRENFRHREIFLDLLSYARVTSLDADFLYRDLVLDAAKNTFPWCIQGRECRVEGDFNKELSSWSRYNRLCKQVDPGVCRKDLQWSCGNYQSVVFNRIAIW